MDNDTEFDEPKGMKGFVPASETACVDWAEAFAIMAQRGEDRLLDPSEVNSSWDDASGSGSRLTEYPLCYDRPMRNEFTASIEDGGEGWYWGPQPRSPGRERPAADS